MILSSKIILILTDKGAGHVPFRTNEEVVVGGGGVREVLIDLSAVVNNTSNDTFYTSCKIFKCRQQ